MWPSATWLSAGSASARWVSQLQNTCARSWHPLCRTGIPLPGHGFLTSGQGEAEEAEEGDVCARLEEVALWTKGSIQFPAGQG